MKPVVTIFLIFLLLSFISGIYYCVTHKIPTSALYNKEGFDPSTDLQGPTTIDCPDMLIKSGNSLILLNSRLPEIPGVNPFPFYSLDEYINYLENQRKKGIRCPILFVQEEYNTQGETVYRIRPDVFQPQGGLPIQTNMSQTVIQDMSVVSPAQAQAQAQVEVTDASRDNQPWNANQHYGFDPMGLYIGKYTAIDAIHDSTFQGKPLSDNPMDNNWGGVFHTKSAVESGKYKENEVIPPNQSVFAEKSDNVKMHKSPSEINIFA
jgi:hypothetical protein